jgi:hypothetical protein
MKRLKKYNTLLHYLQSPPAQLQPASTHPLPRLPWPADWRRTHLTPHAFASGGMLAQAAVAGPDERPKFNAVRRAKESRCVIVNGWHLS